MKSLNVIDGTFMLINKMTTGLYSDMARPTLVLIMFFAYWSFIGKNFIIGKCRETPTIFANDPHYQFSINIPLYANGFLLNLTCFNNENALDARFLFAHLSNGEKAFRDNRMCVQRLLSDNE